MDELGPQPGLCLVLLLGISSSAWCIRDPADQTQVGCMLGKCSAHYTITPDPLISLLTTHSGLGSDVCHSRTKILASEYMKEDTMQNICDFTASNTIWFCFFESAFFLSLLKVQPLPLFQGLVLTLFLPFMLEILFHWCFPSFLNLYIFFPFFLYP